MKFSFKRALKKSFSDANQEFLRVWYFSWKVVLPLSAAFEIFEFFATKFALAFGPEWLPNLVMILTSLISSGVFIIVLPPYIHRVRYNLPPPKIKDHFKKYFAPVTIESLRVVGKMAVGFLLLIIPFFIRMIRLYFVPFVVQFDKRYEAGEIDALEESTKLVKGRFWAVVVLLTPPTLISMVEMVKTYVPQESIYSTLAFLLTLFSMIYTQIMLFSIYESLMEDKT